MDGTVLQCNLVCINVHSVFPVILLIIFFPFHVVNYDRASQATINGTQLFLMIYAIHISIRRFVHFKFMPVY